MHKLVVVPYQTVPACRLCEMVVALSMSLVNTAAARPYAVLFALSMTSSISLNLIICCTGPNIYSTGKKIIIIYDQGWKWWATKHKLNNSNQASSNKLLLILVFLFCSLAKQLVYSLAQPLCWTKPKLINN